MLDHLGINVPDLTVAKSYYDVMMPLLGFEPFFATDEEFSYRPAEGKPGTFLFFYSAPQPNHYKRKHVGLQHIAFKVRTREHVDEAHAKALELGNEILYAPKLFPEYHEHYYATFWFDPHGFLLELVCHKPPAGS